ncbi:MAG: hypothetical protein Q8M08_03855 [Bacteroidales bacterium]|nr:hypothetical protein [Bacteroidales bacterium]
MKKSSLATTLIFFIALFVISACTEEKKVDPCNGTGVLNVENKLDSTISVKIMETHNTMSIGRDFTLPFTLPGNQPYKLTIDGPQYHKDTTIMVLFCDNKLLIVTK